MLHRRSFVAAALAGAALPASAQTAPWPSKPIKLVVPYAPGGTTDVVARVVAEYLGQRLGQNIIVDNKPGKGAMVGTALVAKAPPDGYTLLMSVISGLSISPTLYGGGDFDPMADFIHISIASTNPSVLVVNPNFGPRTFKEYVEYAKANPGKVSYATSGAGSSNHLLGVRLEQVIGAGLVHIPYRGAGPAMVDTIAGNVPSMFDSLPSAAPHIKGENRVEKIMRHVVYSLLPVCAACVKDLMPTAARAACTKGRAMARALAAPACKMASTSCGLAMSWA